MSRATTKPIGHFVKKGRALVYCVRSKKILRTGEVNKILRSVREERSVRFTCD
jgi:hypothetical protein